MKALDPNDVYRAISCAAQPWSDDPLLTFLNAHRETIAREVRTLRSGGSHPDDFTLYVPARFFADRKRVDMKIWSLKVELADVPTLIIGREVAL